MTNLTNVVEVAKELDMDLEKVKAELKKVQSVKCRLLKQKAKETYEAEMTEVIKREQLLKEVRAYIEPKKPTVTTITQEQVDLLTYDDTIKAIKSIQSKKCNTRWMVADESENVEYQEALRIEKMLLEHKKKVAPIEENVIKKSTLNDEIERLLSLGMITEEAAEQMRRLV